MGLGNIWWVLVVPGRGQQPVQHKMCRCSTMYLRPGSGPCRMSSTDGAACLVAAAPSGSAAPGRRQHGPPHGRRAPLQGVRVQHGHLVCQLCAAHAAASAVCSVRRHLQTAQMPCVGTSPIKVTCYGGFGSDSRHAKGLGADSGTPSTLTSGHGKRMGCGCRGMFTPTSRAAPKDEHLAAPG